jgi:hypothetical protein
MTLSSTHLIIYLTIVKPYQTLLSNILEIFNEITFLLCGYCCFLFTNFIDNIQTKYDIGWIFIAIVLTDLVTNILAIFANLMITIAQAIK